MNQEPSNKKFRYQLISVSLASIVSSAINGIIAYIAVYFFRPLWEKTMKWWKNEV